jgi:hypothetical protein
MRRLLLLLVGLMAFGTMVPATPGVAAHHHHAMPPGHCGDEGKSTTTHICLGCVVDPAMPATIDPIVPTLAMVLTPHFVSMHQDHRPGFDPPPPRALG